MLEAKSHYFLFLAEPFFIFFIFCFVLLFLFFKLGQDSNQSNKDLLTAESLSVSPSFLLMLKPPMHKADSSHCSLNPQRKCPFQKVCWQKKERLATENSSKHKGASTDYCATTKQALLLVGLLPEVNNYSVFNKHTFYFCGATF